LGEVDYDRVIFREMDTNDTWARDHGGISVFDEGTPMLYDFVFNGWGMKFAANHDNLITRNLCHMKTFSGEVVPANMQPFVLEGGSIESDGKGTLMTTVECLASVNRNEYLQQEELERYLKDVFGLDRILWITSGYLAGDDTDSHVDTLARFCSEDTIAYVRCEDEEDEHYEELKAMEEEIKEFTRANGEPYRLIPLPMADKVEWEGERLPATYANFLIMNGAALASLYSPLCQRYSFVVLILLSYLIGCSYYSIKLSPGLYHNTAVVLEKDGTIAGKYRKMHIPDDPAYYEKFYFTPGDLGFEPIDTSVGRLGVLVCWDQWYPEAARLMAMRGAEMLIYPTAIGWESSDTQEEKDRQLGAWVTIQRGHAVANGLPVISVNRTGHEPDPSGQTGGIRFWGNSLAAGPQGELLTVFPNDEEEVRVIEIDKTRSENVRRWWPFFRDRRIDAFGGLTERFLV